MRKLAALAIAVAVTISGCSGVTSVRDVPLPGGAELGEHPYRVKARFEHILDLVPQAAVRVNDVAVGRVESVDLPASSWEAEVTLLVNGKVKLPADAVAYLEQSSLLGEKYVQLAPPAGGGTGRLADGAVIPKERTDRNPEVEEVFGALSLLLNGGGLDQIRTISRELNAALDGNEDGIRSALRRLNKISKNLDGHKDDIIALLEKLNRLGSSLNTRKKKIETVLDDLEPGLGVLARQRGALVAMLKSLTKLSKTVKRVIGKSKDDIVAGLKDLAPVLKKLADSGRNLPKSLEILLTYPFTDEIMNGPLKGDYINAYISVTAAPGHDCIIPPVEIPSPRSPEALARGGVGTLAIPPKGPQPVPCGTPEPDPTPDPTEDPTENPAKNEPEIPPGLAPPDSPLGDD